MNFYSIMNPPLISFPIGGAHLDFIVNATGKIDMGKMYNNGDHIACWVSVISYSSSSHALALFLAFPVLSGLVFSALSYPPNNT